MVISSFSLCCEIGNNCRRNFALLAYRSGLLTLLQEGGITGVEDQYQQLITEHKGTYQKWYYIKFVCATMRLFV